MHGVAVTWFFKAAGAWIAFLENLGGAVAEQEPSGQKVCPLPFGDGPELFSSCSKWQISQLSLCMGDEKFQILWPSFCLVCIYRQNVE